MHIWGIRCHPFLFVKYFTFRSCDSQETNFGFFALVLVHLFLIMGREGFEPPKAYATWFTATPIWPLWNLPKDNLKLKAQNLKVKTVECLNFNNLSFIFQELFFFVLAILLFFDGCQKAKLWEPSKKLLFLEKKQQVWYIEEIQQSFVLFFFLLKILLSQLPQELILL
jgi:hypothetical protein